MLEDLPKTSSSLFTKIYHVGCLLVFSLSVTTASAIIVNGDFETGDSTGWTIHQTGGSEIGVYTGTGGTMTALPSAGDGNFAFSGEQSGPSQNIWIQVITLPDSFSEILLSFDLSLNNTGADYFIPDPNTLAFSGITNQQFRMDILTNSSAFDSLASEDVITNVYQTFPGDAVQLAWTTISMDLTAILTPYAGQSVQLRFAGIDNSGPFGVGFDNVEVTAVPEPSVTVAGIGLITILFCFGHRLTRRNRYVPTEESEIR